MSTSSTGSAQPLGYEFTESENVTLGNTAKYARWWGIMSIASGVLLVLMAGLVLAVLAAVGSALSGRLPALSKGALIGAVVGTLGPLGLVYIVCGVLYLQTGTALQEAVVTEGQDVPLLMSALRTLSRAFMIEALATILAFVVGLGIGAAGSHP
jgi:hypothetical protein